MAIDHALAMQDHGRVASLFQSVLIKLPSVSLWQKYIDYVQVTAPDSLQQAYERALDNIGLDFNAGPLWRAYIAYIDAKPALSAYEAMKKQTQLRQIYRKCTQIPSLMVEMLWKSYDAFENREAPNYAKKNLSEASAQYMTARVVSRELKQMLHDALNSLSGPTREFPGLQQERQQDTFSFPDIHMVGFFLCKRLDCLSLFHGKNIWIGN